MDELEELALYLRPPGQGIHTISSGRAEQEAFTRAYLGLAASEELDWKRYLQRAPELKGRDAVALLAIPSDAGAGIMRGASHGPRAIRQMLGRAPVFDLGDVFSVPHFIDDEMLSGLQIARAQEAIYPQLDERARKDLPVSPLTMAARVLELLQTLNPKLRVLLLGGDHTVTWPMIDVLLAKHRDAAIVHFDAHTDLLAERLGVKYCFATWAYHANELLGRNERLLQIGIRVSSKNKEHWEKHLGVRQIWAQEALSMTPDALADEVASHLEKIGAKSFFISNDLDGTDMKWASACGTPEAGGLTREHVLAVIKKLGSTGLSAIGADVVELAPGLSLSEERARVSIETAVKYTLAEIEALRNSRF